MLAEYAVKDNKRYFKTDLLVTSVLHDTIKDTKLTVTMIASIFGKAIASQVESLTRVKIDRKISAAEMINLQKWLVSLLLSFA